MSEKSSDSNLGGYVFVALIAGATVYFFTKPSTPPMIESVTATAAPTENASYAALPATLTANPTIGPVAPQTITAPSHRYEGREGTTYYYSASVSEEQKKNGKQAPDMLAFWYLGKNFSGDDAVALVQNGSIIDLANCNRPCKIIHKADGSTVAFDQMSVIGAVFIDAQNGLLKKHQFPKPRPAPAQPPNSYPSQPTSIFPDPSAAATDN